MFGMIKRLIGWTGKYKKKSLHRIYLCLYKQYFYFPADHACDIWAGIGF